ncbi:unnamed protein product [Lactuca virosa]|uniref:Uncharacterized protein n=1 Tax=Lactuca virosa TaxID=75947 RepID=A0AAU9PCT9_9ASTR|nr:unnamed protein product [Lactuca virosa]
MREVRSRTEQQFSGGVLLLQSTRWWWSKRLLLLDDFRGNNTSKGEGLWFPAGSRKHDAFSSLLEMLSQAKQIHCKCNVHTSSWKWTPFSVDLATVSSNLRRNHKYGNTKSLDHKPCLLQTHGPFPKLQFSSSNSCF